MYPYNIDMQNNDMPADKPAPQTISAQNESSDDKLAELIAMAIEEENTDARKYKALSEVSENEEDIELLRSMYIDESRHKKMLIEIYEEFFGKVPEIEPIDAAFTNPDLVAEYNKNILTEIEGARFYRDLANMFDDDHSHNAITSILNDEQDHAILNTYMYHKNK